MTPRKNNQSGADLAARLENVGFPKAAPAAPVAEQEPTTEKRAKLSKGGRPSKSGGPDAINVTVRLPPGDHDALAKVALDLKAPGRPMLTVQDVMRKLVRGALNDPDTLTRLVKEGEV